MSVTPLDTPADYQPTKMTRGQYDAKRHVLVVLLEGAQAAEKAYQDAYDRAARVDGLPALPDGYGDAWNAAHDAVAAVQSEIDLLDREWRMRNVDPVQRWLVANNID